MDDTIITESQKTKDQPMTVADKLAFIADSGPLLHIMNWENVGKTCSEANLAMAFARKQIRNVLVHLEPVENANRLPMGLATLNGLRETLDKLK